MQDACHPDTTDRSMGCFGISGTHSDDQSGPPGFMMVVVVHAVRPIQRNMGGCFCGGARHSPNLRSPTILQGQLILNAYIQLLAGVLAQLFASTFMQSVSFKPTSGILGPKHPSILECPNSPRLAGT